MRKEIAVESNENKEIIDITSLIERSIAEKKEGTVNIFVKHTTAALTLSEIGEGTEEDLLEIVQKLIPSINFRHGHDPSHASDHMIGSIIGPTLTIPIINGRLDLGTWQRVVLLELHGPRTLNLLISF